MVSEDVGEQSMQFSFVTTAEMEDCFQVQNNIMNAGFEKILLRLQNLENITKKSMEDKTTGMMRENVQEEEVHEAFVFKPITNITDLMVFETLIATDSTYKSNVTKYFKSIFGEKVYPKGYTLAYDLIRNELFDRYF